MVMGTYDPLGLISLALLHRKLLLCRLYGPQVATGWDADLPPDEKIRWAAWFLDLLMPAEAIFPQSTKPANASGSRRLAGFGDASLQAICVVVYVVWTDKDGTSHPRVLTGKCRVAPLSGTTVPRGELQAIVVLHRLLLTVAEAFPYRFSSISAFSDSLCSLGALHKPCSTLKPYFGNRVLEILRLREQLKMYTDDLAPVSHIPGEDNPADIGTRGSVNIGDLGPGSTWQLGASFLNNEFETWPRMTIEDAESNPPPPEECRVLFGTTAAEDAQKVCSWRRRYWKKSAPNHGWANSSEDWGTKL